MVVRVVLATVLAAALLAASLPAVESVRTDRTTAAMERTIDQVERAGSRLLTDEAADAGARRVVTVSLPARSFTAAGVDQFTVRCSRECTIDYRVAGGDLQSRRLPSVPLATPDGPVTFSTVGTHRLALGLRRQNGSRVVTVRG